VAKAYIAKGAKIDCLSFVMCPLLAKLIIGFFSFFAAAVYSTNEANKAGPKQSIFLDVYGPRHEKRGCFVAQNVTSKLSQWNSAVNINIYSC